MAEPSATMRHLCQFDLVRISARCSSGQFSKGFDRLRRAREQLHELESTKSLLNQLQSLLNAHCRTVKQKMTTMTLRIGVASLPDEILSDILLLSASPRRLATRPPIEFSLEPERQVLQEAITLSHVCRRFYSTHHASGPVSQNV